VKTRIVVVTVSLLVLALAGWYVVRFWEIEAPQAEAYEISGDRQLTVYFCGSTADTIVWKIASEDAHGVLVGARMSRNRELFANGVTVTMSVELTAPLGDRVVRTESGKVLGRGKGFLCPG
jgi:hypothetical protein